MRELRLVGGSADSERVVVETVDGAEQFTLRTDDLRRFLADDATPPVQASPSAPIPPREIQMRVRAGEAPNVLADESGVSIDRVLLFAGPVLDERSRMADEARRARARRSTPDGQLVNFGEAVDERFAAHGIDPMSVQWDSHRRDDGQWIVSAGWRGGESERTAEWSFSLASRAVTPLDETASDLLSDRPIRPVVSIVPDLPAAPTSAPDALTGPLPLMVERPAAGDEELFDGEAAAPANETPPLPLHLVEQAAARAAHPTASSHPSASAHPTAATHPSAHPSAGAHAAPADERPTVTTREDETDEQKAARARIPSWDDILLGVRRKRD